MIEITEPKNKADAKRLGNLSHTFRAKLQNAIGNHSDVYVTRELGGCMLGTVKTTAGHYYDWWTCEDGTLCIEEAE